MGSKYVIVAGISERPATLVGQHLEKKQGQAIKSSGGEHIYKLPPQDIGLPNKTDAWGRRVITDASGKITSGTKVVDIKDKEYKGEIQFLKWGDKDGYLITCRFLSGYNTLDLQYQDLVLNAAQTIKDDDASSADIYFLRLQSGENIYDEDSQRYMVQMLKIHSYNQNSESKNPEHYNWQFKEKSENALNLKEAKVYSAQFEALKIVQEAAQDNTLARLRTLRAILTQILPVEILDEQLYQVLAAAANTDPDLFLGQVKEHKKFISNMFEKLKSYDAIDLTKDDVIGAGKEKKQVFKVPGKKEAKLEWLLANYLDEKASTVIFQLTQIADTLK